MADYFKDIDSLLGKQGPSLAQIIGEAWAMKGERSKPWYKVPKLRNIMALTFGLNVRDQNKLQQVRENLNDNIHNQQFEKANLLNIWEKYKGVIDDEKGFLTDKYYFNTQAEGDFNKLNPNYDISLQSARDWKVAEIESLEKALKREHEERMKRGTKLEIDPTMTQEKFTKSYDDYFRNRQKQTASPTELSSVHELLGFVGFGKKKRSELDTKVLEDKKAYERFEKGYAYLLDPMEVQTGEEIERTRDPNQFSYSLREAKLAVVQNFKFNADQQQDIINSLNQKTYTREELQDHILSRTLDFDQVIFDMDKVGKSYDQRYLRLNKKSEVPVSGDPEYLEYVQGRQLKIDEASGLFDETTIDIRTLIRAKRMELVKPKDEQIPAIVDNIDKRLLEYSEDSIDRTILATVLGQLSDPVISEEIKQLINNGTYDSIEDYVQKQLGTLGRIAKDYRNREEDTGIVPPSVSFGPWVSPKP